MADPLGVAWGNPNLRAQVDRTRQNQAQARTYEDTWIDNFLQGVMGKEDIGAGVLDRSVGSDKRLIANNAGQVLGIGADLTGPAKALGLGALGMAVKPLSKSMLRGQIEALSGHSPSKLESLAFKRELDRGRMEANNLAGPLPADPINEKIAPLMDLFNAVDRKTSNLYHATPQENITAILAQGLDPAAKKRFPGTSAETGVYLATTPEAARYYTGPQAALLRTKKDYTPENLTPDLLGGQDVSFMTPKAIPPDALEMLKGKKWVSLTQQKDLDAFVGRQMGQAWPEGRQAYNISTQDAMSQAMKLVGPDKLQEIAKKYPLQGAGTTPEWEAISNEMAARAVVDFFSKK